MVVAWILSQCVLVREERRSGGGGVGVFCGSASGSGPGPEPGPLCRYVLRLHSEEGSVGWAQPIDHEAMHRYMCVCVSVLW